MAPVADSGGAGSDLLSCQNDAGADRVLELKVFAARVLYRSELVGYIAAYID